MSATLDELFPFEYSGGGYFRRKGVPKGDVADILHGMQAVEYLYAAMQPPVCGECEGTGEVPANDVTPLEQTMPCPKCNRP